LPKYSIREEEFEKINKNIALFFDVVYDLNYKHTPIVEYIKNNHPEIIICD
jgi:stage III sporulation protein SpoIIIAA